MAEFCAQCAKEMFPPDVGQDDFIGLTSVGNQMANLFALVLCEGCGPIQVDFRGRCISHGCLEKHNA